MMRTTIIIVIVAAVLGVASGGGFAFWSYYRFPEQTSLELGLVTPKEEAVEGFPAVELDEDEFDFGSMDGNGTGNHVFVIRNVGEAPLELEAGATTCKCTLSEIGDKVIPPGGSGEVTIEWYGKGLYGPFTQTATIKTNDPRNPTVDLRIRGELTTKVRLIPDSLVFSSVTAGLPAHGTVLVYGYEVEGLEIGSFEVEELDNLEVAISPMPKEQIEEEKYATCGQRVDVTVKPGLPLGPFNGKILLKTNVDDPEQLTIPVKGAVSSEISILGAGWIADRATLRLGSIGKSKTVRKLLARVGGVHPEEIHFEVAGVEPDFMIVRLGEPTNTPGSRVVVTPIEIEIPEGSPPCNYLGPKLEKLARIRLKTNHPTVKELDIYVQFLISG